MPRTVRPGASTRAAARTSGALARIGRDLKIGIELAER
jgi:hypothetical protein